MGMGFQTYVRGYYPCPRQHYYFFKKENEDMQQHILELEKAIELQNENISTLKTKLKHPVRTLSKRLLIRLIK